MNSYEEIDNIADRIHQIHFEVYRIIHHLCELKLTSEAMASLRSNASIEELDGLAKELKGLAINLRYTGYETSVGAPNRESKPGLIIENGKEVLKGSS